MAFRLDISDMERHKVEFRLACNKAMRRFTQANMLEVYEKILHDHLSNASNQPRENQIEINRINSEEADKLCSFVTRIIDTCQNASETELIQDSLRRGLIYARNKQQTGGAPIDPMCLFCMGLFSGPQATQAPLTPLSTTPRYIRHANPQAEPEDDHHAGDDTDEQQVPELSHLSGDDIDEGPGEQQEPAGRANLDHSHANTNGHAPGSERVAPLESHVALMRAQRPVDYRPPYQPPTPDDEDANIEGNEDNEFSVEGTSHNGPINSNGDHHQPNQAHEDSPHSWFNRQVIDTKSDFLSDSFKSHIMATVEPHAYDQQSDTSEEEDEHEHEHESSIVRPNQPPKQSTGGDTKKVFVKRPTTSSVSRSSINIEVANASLLLNQHLADLEAPIDRQAQNVIRRAQLMSVPLGSSLSSSSSSTQVQAPSQGRKPRDRLSNSKQFRKFTDRGKKGHARR